MTPMDIEKLKQERDEAIRNWKTTVSASSSIIAHRAKELLTWLQKPVTEMETSDPAAYLIVSAFIDKVRQQAGRDRAVQELRAIGEQWRAQAQGGPDTGHASVLFLRADEIVKEGK